MLEIVTAFCDNAFARGVAAFDNTDGSARMMQMLASICVDERGIALGSMIDKRGALMASVPPKRGACSNQRSSSTSWIFQTKRP